MRAIGLGVVAVALLAGTVPLRCEPVKLWETKGLSNPESALPVPDAGFAYVSNIAGNVSEKDGNGFVSKVSLADGKITTLKWATGLDAPKGLALVGDGLYTANIDQLVEIDTKTGKIAARYEAPGSKFLNDVAADSEGNVYVSDSGTSAIWRLAGGTLEKWLEGPQLNNVNGLLVVGDKLILAPWGQQAEDGSAEPAHLLEVSLKDKSVRSLGSGNGVGNLDGIEPFDASSYLVTDWVEGALHRIDRSGKVEHLLDLGQGSADIGYVPATRTVLIPMLKDDTLLAYRLE